MSQGSLDPKIWFLGQNVCSVARIQTDRQTDTQTDTKVNTEDTLSGFQEFFLRPIIKDRSNIDEIKTSTTPICSGPIPAQKSWGNSVLGGRIFPTRCPKWIFIILIVLVEKKHTKLIYHMPWLGLLYFPAGHFPGERESRSRFPGNSRETGKYENGTFPTS